MKLRTFTAATMKEAMARVRDEMGPDAVIVYAHERRRGGGVEVRAAVDSLAEPPPVSKPKSVAPRAAAPAKAQAKLAVPAPPASPAKKTTPKGLVALAHAAKVAPADARVAETLDTLRHILSFHGVPERTAVTLLDAARRLDLGDPAQLLATALDTRFAFSPLPEKPRRPIMLVGGPGVGKTVTTAKLAARARLAGHRVHVITTDTLRSGAVDQLDKLIARMGLKLETADSPASLAARLSRYQGDKAPIVLVDTPGTNVFNTAERHDLAQFVDTAVLEPVFVQAAGGDAGDAADIAAQFTALGVRRMIVTRLDAARRLGALLSAAEAGGLAIAQVSLSPYLSEALSTLSAGSLARVLATQAGSVLRSETAPALPPPARATTARPLEVKAP